jgi:hypothetical protein
MDFWFQFLDIHVNEQARICHDCLSFKWKNIIISFILTIFVRDLTPFLVHWIIITLI